MPRLSETPPWPEPSPIALARAGIASKLSLCTAALALGLFVVERALGAPLDAESYLLLFLVGVSVVAWALLKSRHYVTVVWFVVASLLSIAVVSTYTFGSVRTVDTALILVGQIVVGVFLSRRALVWTTLGAILLLGALAWADASGLLLRAPDFGVGLRTFLSQAACLTGVAIMMHLNRTQMRVAQDLHLLEAQQRLQAQLDRDLGHGRFKRIFHSSPTPIYVQSALTGKILNVNPACERALGYPRKALLDKRDGFLWVRDPQYEGFVRDRRSALRTDWHPVTAIRSDGEHLPLMVCRERDEDPQERLVITFLRPVGAPTLSPTQPSQSVENASDWLILDRDTDV